MAEKFRNPAATATIIFARDNVYRETEILYVKRKSAPYKGMLALPGGFLNYGEETLERTAQRESLEEVNLRLPQKYLELLCVNSSPERDPRGHVIDHVYIARQFTGKARAGDDAAELYWIALGKEPKMLAFDHSKNLWLFKEWRKRT